MKSTVTAIFGAAAFCAGAAQAQGVDHSQHQMPAQPAQAAAPEAGAPDPHAGHDMGAAETSAPDADPHRDHRMANPARPAALGAYPMSRDASGTSWQPDAGSHGGIHLDRNGWLLMGHAVLNGVYDWQDGPRGDEMSFVSGMVMGLARRRFDSGDALSFRAMLSPDPLMGQEGYPLLLATGETADGVTPLIDRQHPHDLFMELSATYAHQLDAETSLFVYAGLPGEPAFGPPAFMHRQSIMDSPEAPISHHWLDSTHITFGVLTGGFVHANFKLEGSAFKGREPDEHRYDIEAPKLDSLAARLSWNPGPNLSLQVSWAQVHSPEQLEPDNDETRFSASAIYTVPLGENGWWSTTAAWGRKDHHDEWLNALVLETAVKPSPRWTVFGRAERTENIELDPSNHHAQTVSKISIGAVHDVPVAANTSIGLGALYTWNFISEDLQASYGGDPNGAMVFIRLKIG